MPEGIIKFSYEDVVPGDRVLEISISGGQTKRKKYKIEYVYNIADVDYEDKICLINKRIVRTNRFNERNNIVYYIDRRPRYSRRFSSL